MPADAQLVRASKQASNDGAVPETRHWRSVCLMFEKHSSVWTPPGLFLPPAKQVKHTVAMAPRHMGKQRRWGREGTKGWWPASASTAWCSVGQANKELAAGYLLDRSDLILPVINQSSRHAPSIMQMLTVRAARMPQ